MKSVLRGIAALSIAAAVWPAGAMAQDPAAQDKTTLTTERDRISYMVGMDVGRSIGTVGPDLDLKAFERAVDNAFDGGKPLISEDEAKTLGPALMQRVAVRSGKPLPGMAPGAEPPPVAKDKVGYLIGADVGRSLTPIKDEIDMPVMLQGLRAVLDQKPTLLSDADAEALRKSFSTRIQARRPPRPAGSTPPRARHSWPRTRTSKACSPPHPDCSTWCCARARARGRCRFRGCA
jgi:FKBP-type peptidyl-prolyl cis-trans isomerase FkpA